MKFLPTICYLLLACSDAAAAVRNPLRQGGATWDEEEYRTDAKVAKLGPAIRGTTVFETVTPHTNDEVIKLANVDGTANSAVANSVTDGIASSVGADLLDQKETHTISSSFLRSNIKTGINTTKDRILNGAQTLHGQRELVWSGGSSCPEPYTTKNYFAGEIAAHKGQVYQCASSPTNLFCGMLGYRPEVDQYWKVAWTFIGSCSGILASVPAMTSGSSAHLGGCPDVWQHGIHTLYKEWDQVSKDGKVFQCKAYPYSGHCSQQGYEPLTNLATPGVWMDAWEWIGYCEGDFRPTTPVTLKPTLAPTTQPPPTMFPVSPLSRSPSKTPTTPPSLPIQSPTVSPMTHFTGNPTTPPASSPIRPSSISPTAENKLGIDGIDDAVIDLVTIAVADAVTEAISAAVAAGAEESTAVIISASTETAVTDSVTAAVAATTEELVETGITEDVAGIISDYLISPVMSLGEGTLQQAVNEFIANGLAFAANMPYMLLLQQQPIQGKEAALRATNEEREKEKAYWDGLIDKAKNIVVQKAAPGVQSYIRNGYKDSLNKAKHENAKWLKKEKKDIMLKSLIPIYGMVNAIIRLRHLKRDALKKFHSAATSHLKTFLHSQECREKWGKAFQEEGEDYLKSDDFKQLADKWEKQHPNNPNNKRE